MWHSNHDKAYALLKNVIKGSKVKFKDAPIELKINGNDPYDLLDMLKIYLEIDSRALRGPIGRLFSFLCLYNQPFYMPPNLPRALRKGAVSSSFFLS